VSLFRENIDPRCVYCLHSVPLEKRDELGCLRHGVVDAASHCRGFKYDPFKRVPPKPVRLRKNYTDKDFQL
jgi:hypothetical protein